MIKSGVRYLITHAWTRVDSVIWILALPASVYVLYRSSTDDRVRLPETLAASFVGAHMAFVVLSGGDFMEAGRFLVQGIPAVIVVGLGFARMSAPAAVLRPAVAILISLNLLGTVLTARNESVGSPAWGLAVLDSLPRQSDTPWFERMNRNLYAEEVLAVRLEILLQRLQQQKDGTISIMSGNMGIVPYRISSKHDGAVRFIDVCGLVSRDFIDCPISSPLPRTQFGLAMSYTFFFDHHRQLADACALGDPDIIISVDRPDHRNYKRIEGNGYSVAYFQEVNVASGSRYFPGADVVADELIAVRNDLMSPGVQLGVYNFSR